MWLNVQYKSWAKNSCWKAEKPTIRAFGNPVHLRKQVRAGRGRKLNPTGQVFFFFLRILLNSEAVKYRRLKSWAEGF